jgi:hypothetical protein
VHSQDVTFIFRDREDSLSRIIENNGQKQRWNKLDAYILVHK